MEKQATDESKTCIIFSPNDVTQAGALAKLLKIFEVHKIHLSHIESRSSTRVSGYEFMVEIEDSENPCLNDALDELKDCCSYFQIISRDFNDDEMVVPWFPLRIRDLDRFANQILSYGSELDADHPGKSLEKFN